MLRTQTRKTYKIADLFCGAGGTSEGAIQAFTELGHDVEVRAINHWRVATETHKLNHPDADVLCTGIESVNPRDYYEPGELFLLLASPECTHHSIARGGKPINEQSRATAFCVLNWINALLPPVVLIENVKEFLTWGPLDSKGRPIKARKGEQFRAWVSQIEAAGYKVEWRVFCCADYGDPTTRERLFIQAVRGRRKIVWPEQTHAKDPSADLLRGALKPWVPAREIIDWSIRGTLLTERKSPLVQKTMDRIITGFMRQVREKGISADAFITPNFGERENQTPRTHDIDSPLPTVTGHGAGCLVEPVLIQVNHGNGKDPNRNGNDRRIKSMGDTLGTLTTKGSYGLAEPLLIHFRGTAERHVTNSGRTVDEPLPCVTAGGIHTAVVEPYVVGIDNQSGNHVRSGAEPLSTITTKARHCVVEPIVQPFTLGQQTCSAARPVSEPIATVATAGAVALIEPMIVKYYGTGGTAAVTEPLSTVTTKERFALVLPVITIGDQRWLVDFRFRMLQPHELAGAQGFPKWYKFTGNKTEQVKQIGNAVPCGMAKALVRAILKA